MGDPNNPTDEPMWDRLVSLHGRIEQELAKALHRRHGLGLSEYRALRHLGAANDHELRIQELAEAVGLNQSSVSRLVARLEAAGLTRRAVCDNDRRGVYSVITDEGLRLVATSAPTYRKTLLAALDNALAEPGLADVVRALRQASMLVIP